MLDALSALPGCASMNAVSSAQEERHGDGDPSAATPKLCPSCGTRYRVDALFCPTDGAPLQNAATSSGPDVDPYIQKEILGHIRIKQLAGIGAMGRVYRAFQTGIDRDVAVKILHRELSANQQLVARFHREAKVASRLSHANVVHAYLTGQLPDGSMYIVMEYLDGLSLQSALAAVGGAMPLPRALHIALQICDATGEAHAQGIVHRDIKPENVMLVRRAEDPDYVKVLDFGIARLNWGDQSMATAAGLIFGTARYISPEGAQGEQVGPTGDVYAVATLAYQMLAGRTPFEGESAVSLLVQQIHDPPPQLRSIPRAAYVPEPIAQLIMKNLGKNPSERSPDARAFGRALLDAARASGLSADDLISRPGLSGRGSAQMQIASMQRTRQLHLDPQTAERIGAVSATPPPEPSARSGTPPPRTSYEPPSHELHTPAPVGQTAFDPPHSLHPSQMPPGAATAKWAPAPGFQEMLATPAPHFPVPRARTSSVDLTMDDDPSTQPPPYARARADSLPATAAESATHRTARMDGPHPALAPLSAPSQRALPTHPPSKPTSSADITLGDDDDVKLPGRGRAVIVILVCFFIGVTGAVGIAYKLGLIGAGVGAQVSLQTYIDKANDAILHHRWDAPPGDNVRDVTNDGLSQFPNNAELLEVRGLACDEIVKNAKKRKTEGDIAEALRLAKLAHELDPTDADASDLARTYQQVLDDATSIAPLSSVGSPSSSGRAGAIVATSFSAVVDATNSAPRVGQPVEFVARVFASPPNTARAKIDGPTFVIAGAHLAGVSDESGAFHATYTFDRAGKYEIQFDAKANTAGVRATRSITVGPADGRQQPTAQPTQARGGPETSPTASVPVPATAPGPDTSTPPGLTPPQPSATSTAKWM